MLGFAWYYPALGQRIFGGTPLIHGCTIASASVISLAERLNEDNKNCSIFYMDKYFCRYMDNYRHYVAQGTSVLFRPVWMAQFLLLQSHDEINKLQNYGIHNDISSQEHQNEKNDEEEHEECYDHDLPLPTGLFHDHSHSFLRTNKTGEDSGWWNLHSQNKPGELLWIHEWHDEHEMG